MATDTKMGDPFYQAAVKFVEFMGRMPRPVAPPVGPREKSLAILVMPWHSTVIPFYSMLLGAHAALQGYQVTFLWDDLVWYDPNDTLRQNRAIAEVLAALRPYGTVDKVSRHVPMPMDDREARELERLAELNAVWKFRDPERSIQFEDYRKTCLSNFIVNYPRSRSALAATGAGTAVIPGGIVGGSGLFMLAGRGIGMRTATFDCDPGEVIVGVDDVAGHLFDLAKVMEKPEFSVNRADLAWIKAEAERVFGERIQGKDRFKSQVVGLKDSIEKDDLDVLVPLNVMWDSAALGRHTVFDGSLEWVLESVAWMLKNTSARIVVRQHPSERIWQKLFNYQNPMEKRLQDQFGLGGPGGRLRYIRADEECNTYEMMAQAKLVVSATSTVGLEALLLGVPVVSDCRLYYSFLPGVTEARNREEYFAGIQSALSGSHDLDAEIPLEAWVVYFFSQRCNSCMTKVTPLPQDFEEWIQWDPARVLADGSFGNIGAAMFEGKPASYLNYLKLAVETGRRKA